MSFFERTRFRSKQQCNLVNNTTENLFNNTNENLFNNNYENLFNNNYEKKQTTRPDVVLTENMMIDIKIDDQDNDLEMKQNNNDFDNALPPPPKLEGITQLPDLPIIPPLNFQVTNSKKKKPYKQKKTKKTTKKKNKNYFRSICTFFVYQYIDKYEKWAQECTCKELPVGVSEISTTYTKQNNEFMVYFFNINVHVRNDLLSDKKKKKPL